MFLLKINRHKIELVTFFWKQDVIEYALTTATLMACQMLLKWQNKKGKRWKEKQLIFIEQSTPFYHFWLIIILIAWPIYWTLSVKSNKNPRMVKHWLSMYLINIKLCSSFLLSIEGSIYESPFWWNQDEICSKSLCFVLNWTLSFCSLHVPFSYRLV